MTKFSELPSPPGYLTGRCQALNGPNSVLWNEQAGGPQRCLQLVTGTDMWTLGFSSMVLHYECF